MSALKWNDSRIMFVGDMEMSSNRSRSDSQSKYKPVSSQQKLIEIKNQSRTLNNIVKRRKHPSISHSSSSSSAIYSLKKINPTVVTILCAQQFTEQGSIMNEKQKIQNILFRVFEVLKDVNVLFKQMKRQMEDFRNYMSVEYENFSRYVIKSSIVLNKLKRFSTIDEVRQSQQTMSNALETDPIVQNQKKFEILRNKITKIDPITCLNIAFQKKITGYHNSKEQTNRMREKLKDTSFSSRESSLSLEMKNKFNRALSTMKNVLKK